MSEEKTTPELSPALKEKYKLTDYAPGEMEISGFGKVDMTTISLDLANRIHDSGKCPHLVKLDESISVEKKSEVEEVVN